MINQQIKWAKSELQAQGYAINADAKIIRNMPWSQVAYFETSRGFVYLKCTAEVFVNELRLLGFLLKQDMSHLPLLIATNQEQRCFLMQDAGKPMRMRLKTYFDVTLAAEALKIYATIQLSCIERVNALLGIDVPDWRLGCLPFFYNDFMDNQKTLLLDDGLSIDEITALQKLATPFEALCATLSKFGIPETLESGDFHDNNILLRDNQITIHDFGDATISHPFFSLASFLDSAKRHHALSENDPKYIPLLTGYLHEWAAYGTEQTLWDAFQLAQIIRHFVFALNFSRIKTCPGIEKFPEYKGYIADSLRNLIKSV